MGCLFSDNRHWLVLDGMHCERNDQTWNAFLFYELLPDEAQRDFCECILREQSLSQPLHIRHCSLDGRVVQRLHEKYRNSTDVPGQYQTRMDVQMVLGEKLLHCVDDCLVFHLTHLLHPQAIRKDRGWKPIKESRSWRQALK